MDGGVFSLADRVALVTGGNGGLGLAIASALSAAGARVAVTGRDAVKNERARQLLGDGHLVLDADVTDEASVSATVEGLGRRKTPAGGGAWVTTSPARSSSSPRPHPTS